VFWAVLGGLGVGFVVLVRVLARRRERQACDKTGLAGAQYEVDGAQIHVVVMGQGPDLVLLHGASGNLRDFTFDLAKRLKDRYRVLLVDRPGLGHSTQTPNFRKIWGRAGESPRQQARLLRKALDQVGLTTPLVLGHSFGGAVAMAWALEHQDTAGVVLVAGVSHPWPGKLHWQYPLKGSLLGGALLVPLLSAFVPQAYVCRVIASIFAPQPAPKGYVRHVGPDLTLRRAALRANGRQVNGLRPHVVEMATRYPDLTLPIEAVHGEADMIVPNAIHSDPLSRRVQSARLTVLPGVGHMPQHSHPEVVVAAIDRAANRAGLR